MRKTNYENYKKFETALNFLKEAKTVPWDMAHDDYDLIMVSADGESVFNVDTKNFLKPYSGRNGYKRVMVADTEGKVFNPYVHVMVADAFLQNPKNKRYIHHIDGDTSNNALYNLLRVTQSEHDYLHYLLRNNKTDEYWKLVNKLRTEQPTR